MNYCVAFLCGSLFSSLCSFALAHIYGSHIGKSISFLILGVGGGLAFSALGLLAICCAALQHTKVSQYSTKTLAICFLFPLISIVGFTWLFSLGTSAS